MATTNHTLLDASLQGIIPKPEHGLTEIRSLWARRTEASYQRIPLINLEGSLWRNAKTSCLHYWNSQMFANTAKKGELVIEDWINIDVLHPVQQKRLSLEYISIYRQDIIKAGISAKKNGFLADATQTKVIKVFRRNK